MAAPSSIAFKCDIRSNTMHSGPRVLHKYIVLTICHVHFCIAALSSIQSEMYTLRTQRHCTQHAIYVCGYRNPGQALAQFDRSTV